MKRKLLKAIQIFFIVLWGAVLFNTNGFSSVYVLTAVTGIFAVIFNKPWDCKGKIVTAVTGVVLSGLVILANYGIFGKLFPGSKCLMLLAAICTFIGGGCTFAGIVKWGITHVKGGMKTVNHKFRPCTVFIVCAAVIIAVNCAVMFISYYPGITSPDSVNQMEQIYSGIYSNHHPFFHTMLIQLWMKLGMLVFGEINAAVAVYCVFQILAMAVIMAFVVMTLYQIGISYKWLIPVLVWTVFMPFNIYYSFTIWKDILFTGGVVLFITAVLRLIRGIGRNWLNMVLLALGGLTMCLLRSNGWMAFVVMLIVAIFVLERKIVITMAVVFAVGMIIRIPLMSAVGVSQPDFLESIAIPLQQVSKVVAEDGNISEEEKAVLEKIAPIEDIAGNYTWYTVDSEKEVIRNNDGVKYITDNKPDMIKLWLGLGLKNPVAYVTAWIDQTKGYYGCDQAFWKWTVVWDNDFGIVRNARSGEFAGFMERYTEAFSTVPVLQPFVSIGLWVWAAIMLLAIGIGKRKKETLLCIPVVAIFITLLIATPVNSEFRYIYTAFLCMPVMLFGIFTKGNSQ